jgi:glycosyltransferase involved in cell wall biosynthesis
MRPDTTVADIVVDDYPAQRRSLRIAVVTETYPPEVNGVARTIASVVEGLRAHNHDLQLIRPGQKKGERAIDGESFHEVLMRGLPIPRYPQLRMGLTSKRTLVKLWSTQRPDIVHIATEGPMGWSALQAAAHLKIPLCSDFRTNFHAYSKHYGVGWLHKPIMAYLRKFHNLTQCTMTPDEGLRRQLTDYGFRNVVVVSRGVDTTLFHPLRRSAALREQWGVAPTSWWCCTWAAWPPRRTWAPWSRPTRPCARPSRAPAWCWWATARPARRSSSACPRPSSPACAMARTWPPTTPAPTCCSSPA